LLPKREIKKNSGGLRELPFPMEDAMFRPHVAACFVLLAAGCVWGQFPAGDAEPFITDRPGYSDGVNIVPRGLFHWESGFSLNLATRGTHLGVDPLEQEWERNMLAGAPVLRVGVSRRFELRFGGDGVLYHSHRIGGFRHLQTGLSDLAAGFKLALVEERRRIPALSLVTMFSLPVGAPAFSSGAIDPTFKLAWSKGLAKEWTVSGNLNASSLSLDGGGRFVQRAASLQVSRPVWADLGAFAEVYTITPPYPGEETLWTFDGGFTHPLGDYMQMDISCGQQIVPRERTWFLAIGLALRGSLLHGRLPRIRRRD
jgi:hypothetical protein